MVSYTWKVFYSSSADQNNAMLLKVVSLAWNIACYFDAVGKTYPGNLSQSRVGLLRSGSLNSGANASLLGSALVDSDLLLGVVALLKRRSRGFLFKNCSLTDDLLVVSVDWS